jgi:hypothetical protein
VDTSTRLARSALISGTAAAILSALALAVAGRVEGRAAAQTTNATSHWLHGSRAGAVRDVDVAHTLVGYVTHHASALFWAFLFESFRGLLRPNSLADAAGSAVATSVIAAVVDYGLVPRRVTPGWELVVSKRAIASGYLALAAGLMLGGWLADRMR